jgi:hypothetical protein
VTTADPADAQAIAGRNGAASYLVSDHPHDINVATNVDGRLQITPLTLRVMDYRERRYLAYPAIGDQLDALYHAMARGELPMIRDYYDPIAAVKATNPKE